MPIQKLTPELKAQIEKEIEPLRYAQVLCSAIKTSQDAINASISKWELICKYTQHRRKKWDVTQNPIPNPIQTLISQNCGLCARYKTFDEHCGKCPIVLLIGNDERCTARGKSTFSNVCFGSKHPKHMLDLLKKVKVLMLDNPNYTD